MRSNNRFKSSTPSSSHSKAATPPRSPRYTFTKSLMDENFEIAESLISKWSYDSHSSTSSYAKITPLFLDDRFEARQYLKAVKDLQTAMEFYLQSQNTSSEKLVRAQNLMQTAMKRLQKEFYQILSANRSALHPESVSSRSSKAAARSCNSDFEEESEDEIRFANETISQEERASMTALADLKAIADCMLSSGYGKECVKTYNIVRKSIVDETLYRLGVERLRLSQVQKMDWEFLEEKIRKWLYAVKTAVRTLFDGERFLCDHVFSSSASIRETSFAEISKNGALTLFSFPELVSKHKKSLENIFTVLDLYDAVYSLWPDIESIFSFESTSSVRSQADTSLIKLGEAIRTMLADFESAIQKETSKIPVPNGAVHPLTRYVMNYIAFLSEHIGILDEIFADWPLNLQSPLPESYLGKSLNSSENSITVRIAWFILVLLCKLDGKAELYSDVGLSYIFLANNLQYVVNKVRNSNLKLILNEDWIENHDDKVKQYASNYERMAWSKVFRSLPDDPTAEISPEEARECFVNFNKAFQETHRKQSSWVVPDPTLRDDIKVALCKKLGHLYGGFYDKHRVGLLTVVGSDWVFRYAPDNIGNYLSDIFYGGVEGLSSAGSSPSYLRGKHAQ